mgnify:FL=1|tara:strand:+ start:496 stop:1158 length:663 start_codon:yes stop_codon:yes gene_type:complete
MAISKFNYNSFNVTPVAGRALAFDADADGFTTASGSSMILIKTLTASSSANLSFVDGSSDVVLDSTYPVYIFKYINIHPATDNVEFRFNMSVDTGSNYNVAKTSTYFYSYQGENGADTGVVYYASGDLAQGTGAQPLSFSLGNGNDESLSGELTIYNPSSTTFVKQFIANNNVYHKSNFSQERFVAGYGNTTSAVDAIQFTMSSGNIDDGIIKLYGIADS